MGLIEQLRAENERLREELETEHDALHDALDGEKALYDEKAALRDQLRGAVSEFVAFLRDAGPSSDPERWHALMAKYDPEYPESERGRAHRALGGR